MKPDAKAIRMAQDLIDAIESDEPSPIETIYAAFLDGSRGPITWAECCAAHPADVGLFMSHIEERMKRDRFIDRFGFAVATKAFFDFMARQGPLLEIAAGTGYLSAGLTKLGADVIASDPYPYQHGSAERYCNILPLDGKTAIESHPDRTVLLSWPGHLDPWPEEAIESLKPGQKFFLIGETGGCTGTDALTEKLHSDAFAPISTPSRAIWSFYGLHDRLTGFIRR